MSNLTCMKISALNYKNGPSNKRLVQDVLLRRPPHSLALYFAMNERQEIKTATIKAIKIAILYGALLLLILWLLTPAESNYNLAISIVLSLFLGYCAIRDIKRIVYKKLCAMCGVDIYPIVITAKNLGESIKHCPFCGGKVEKI